MKLVTFRSEVGLYDDGKLSTGWQLARVGYRNPKRWVTMAEAQAEVDRMAQQTYRPFGIGAPTKLYATRDDAERAFVKRQYKEMIGIVANAASLPHGEVLARAESRGKTALGDFQITFPRIWTPSAIKSYLNQISTELQSTAREVSLARSRHGSKVVNDSDLASFKDFYQEVRTWLDSKPSTLWGANVTRAEDYQKRIVTWRRFLAEKGTAATSPEPLSPGKVQLDVPSPEGGAKLAIVLLAGATCAAAIGYAASKVAPTFNRPPKKA